MGRIRMDRKGHRIGTRSALRRGAARLLPVLAILTGAAAIAAAASKPVKTFHGGASTVSPPSLVPRFDPRDEYMETWQFHAWLSGGWTAQVRFVVTNLGPGENNGTVEARLTTPDGRVLRSHPNYKKGEWLHSASEFSIKMGENLAGGGPTSWLVKVVGEEGDFSFNLTFTNTIAAWAPRGGEVTFGDGPETDSYHLDIMAPRAAVAGKIVIGGATHAVKGDGYAHHDRTTLASYKMALTWDRFRGYGPTHSVVFLQFITPAKYAYRAVRWLMVAEGSKVVFTDFGYSLSRADRRPDKATSYGYKPPWAWELAATNPKGRLTGKITAKAMLVVNDFLKEMNPLERAVVKGFAKPVIYDQRCEYDFSLELAGVAPVKIAGSTDACGSSFINKYK